MREKNSCFIERATLLKKQKHFRFFSLGSQDNTVHSGPTYLYSCQLVEYFSGNDMSQSPLRIFRKKMGGGEFWDQINCLSSAGSWGPLLLCHVMSFFHSNTTPPFILKVFFINFSAWTISPQSFYWRCCLWLLLSCLLKYFPMCPVSYEELCFLGRGSFFYSF